MQNLIELKRNEVCQVFSFSYFKYRHMICLFIINMSDKTQSQTFEQLQMSDIRENTPDQLIKGAPESQPTVNNSWKFNIRRCMFLIFMVISSSILLSQINAQTDNLPIATPSDFQFFVYCPYSFKDKAVPPRESKTASNDQLRRRMLFSRYSYNVELKERNADYNWSNTYVVQIESTANGLLYYCGLVTNYNSTCENYVTYECSSPGPMFDLKTSQYADIVWINNLDENHVDVASSKCLNVSAEPIEFCTLQAKLKNSVTFLDPTNHANQTHLISPNPIRPNAWPASTHVHGSQVRPTFDGNPLSWIDNAGKRGIGAFSLSDKCYYSSFDNIDQDGSNYLPPEIVVTLQNDKNVSSNKFKINRYPNIQNPGNLWYHDHAMRLTMANVKQGLAGNYILRNKTVEDEIGVDKANELLVMMTTSGWKNSHSININSDTVYRFRFLNNNFGPDTFRVYFISSDNCNSSNQRIPFTMIGADSSLFNQGINADYFDVASAERIELLIIFKQGIKIFSICSNKVDFSQPSKTFNSIKNSPNPANFTANIQGLKINNDQRLSNKNTRTKIDNIKLDVPFVNFADKDSYVSVKRMRPLMRSGSALSINGRKTFHDGRSENPVIGSYEDWFIINTFGSQHPIHIHLINFQVVNILSLRKVGNCALYQLDFFAKAIIIGGSNTPFLANSSIFPDQTNYNKVNYPYLCSIKTTVNDYQSIPTYLAQVNMQDNIDPITHVSGIDVQKELSEQERSHLKDLNITVPEDEKHKYITNQKNEIKSYYKRWKDTAMVERFKVFVLRIRWAKSSYVDDSNDNNYFHVPVDQLRQFPGFVYHCHILPHQDNQMMRPIMLQLPPNPNINTNTPCNRKNQTTNFSWAQKVKCINEQQCATIK